MLPVLLYLCLLFSIHLSTCKLTWGTTQYLFAFGDDYTSDGFNISAGVGSSVPVALTAPGATWVQYLAAIYNVAGTRALNLASNGATTDSDLVPPSIPNALSLVEQVTQFRSTLTQKPAGAEWNSTNALFAVWTGINDVRNSFVWRNVSQTSLYSAILSRFSDQIEDLYDCGARSFLFLTLPPIDRSPLFIVQGNQTTARLKALVADYNHQLKAAVQTFKNRHYDLDQVTLFDTQLAFNTMLDDPSTYGFVTGTDYCQAYQNGTTGPTTQIAPCAPVQSYFWLNSFRPMYVVQAILSHGVSTALST